MVTKSINTHQIKGHKQVIIIFVDFRKKNNIEIKTKLQKIKKILKRAKNKKSGSNVQIESEP